MALTENDELNLLAPPVDDEEMELQFGITDNVGDSASKSIEAEMNEFAARELLDGAGKEKVGGSFTRSQNKQLGNSTCPKDMLKRVRKGIANLKESLFKREVDKGSNLRAKNEFICVFDGENENILADLLLLEENLESAETGDKVAQLEADCEEKQRELDELRDDMNSAIMDTQYTKIIELRSGFDEISDELNALKVKEKAMQEQIDQLEKAVDESKGAVGSDLKLQNEVTNALEMLGSDDIAAVTNETLRLRETCAFLKELMISVMKELQVSEVNTITVAIQDANRSRDELIQRNRELEIRLSQALSEREKLQQERNEAHKEIDALKKHQFAVETSEFPIPVNTVGDVFDSELQRLITQRRHSTQVTLPSPRATSSEILPRHAAGGTPSLSQIPGQNGTQNASGNSGAVHLSVPLVKPADLPALQKFNGNRASWKIFQEGFLLRYESMGDRTAKQLLHELLEGKAKTEYEGLPDVYRGESKTIVDCLEWLKDRCFGSKMFSSLELARKFNNMSVNGRSVDAVCEELEFLTSKLYDSVSAREDARKHQLLILYEKDREYIELLKLLQKDEAYDVMKQHLQTVEYVMRRENLNVTSSHNNRNNQRFSRGDGNGGASRMISEKCVSCRGRGHTRDNCPSLMVANSESAAKHVNKNCFNCGGTGHMASVCTSPKWTRHADGSGEYNSSQSVVASAGGAEAEFTLSRQPTYSNGDGWQNRNQNGGVRRISVKRIIDGYGDERYRDGVLRNRPTYKGRGVAKSQVGLEEPRSVKVGGDERSHGGIPRNRPIDNLNGVVKSHVGVEEPLPVRVCGDERNQMGVLRDRQSDTYDNEKRVSDLDDPPLVKEFVPAQCIIGGLNVPVCLDTGADVSMIDKRTVDLISGVKVNSEVVPFNIEDSQGNSIKTVGTAVLDVEMDNCIKCRVKFAISEANVPDIILGRCALDSMGLELRQKESVHKMDSTLSDIATVLNTECVASAEVSTVLNGGVRPGEIPKEISAHRDSDSESSSLRCWHIRGLYAKVEPEALSEVSLIERERFPRKNCVVLIPEDSCILKAKGPFREIDQLPYRDEIALKKHLQDMIDAKIFPRSLVVILKSSLTPSNLAEIKKDARNIVKNFEVTIYFAADLLSSKPTDVESESIKSLQQMLTKWRLTKLPVNLIVISPISGLLWSHHPLATLFVLMRKESTEAFEAAIRFIVDGVPIPAQFSLEPIVEKPKIHAKRSYGTSRGGKRAFGFQSPSSDDPCHYCHETGHFKWNCTNKKMKSFE